MLYARGELFKYQKFDRGNLRGINLSTCVTGANFTKKVFFANYYSERYYPIYTLNASCEKFIRDFYIMLFPHHGTRERVVFDNFIANMCTANHRAGNSMCLDASQSDTDAKCNYYGDLFYTPVKKHPIID